MSDGPSNESPQLLLAMERISAIADDMRDVKTTMGRLADAVTKLAIVEERQVADRQALTRAFSEIDKVSERVRRVEEQQPIQKQSSDWVQGWVKQAVALVAAAVLGGAGVVTATRSPADKAPTAQVAGK